MAKKLYSDGRIAYVSSPVRHLIASIRLRLFGPRQMNRRELERQAAIYAVDIPPRPKMWGRRKADCELRRAILGRINAMDRPLESIYAPPPRIR